MKTTYFFNHVVRKDRERERERERERDLALYKGQFQHAATVSKIVHKQLVQQSVK